MTTAPRGLCCSRHCVPRLESRLSVQRENEPVGDFRRAASPEWACKVVKSAGASPFEFASRMPAISCVPAEVPSVTQSPRSPAALTPLNRLPR